MNKPGQKVSIIISSWGYGKYLKKAIESALSQTVACEVVVFDNASKDETKEVIAGFDNITKLSASKMIPWTKLLNKLINENGSEYIVLLGADDQLEPQFVEKTLAKMKKGVGIVRTGIKIVGAESRIDVPKDKLTLLEEELDNLIPFSSLFRKKCWEEVGGYDEKIPGCEDWDFWIRVMQAGWKVETVKEPLFIYNVHYDSGLFEQKKFYDKIVNYIESKILLYHEKIGDKNEWEEKKKLFLMQKREESYKALILEKDQIILQKDKIIADQEKAIEEVVTILKQIENSKTWQIFDGVRKCYRFIGKRKSQ